MRTHTQNGVDGVLYVVLEDTVTVTCGCGVHDLRGVAKVM